MPKLLVPEKIEMASGDLPGCDEDDKLVVSFRQATESQKLQRQQLLTKPLRRVWDTDGDTDSTTFSEVMEIIPFAQRRMVDIYLTLTGSNIDRQDGKPLFKFRKNKNGSLEIDGTLDEFQNLYGSITQSEWIEFMYDCCLKVNPTFGFSGDIKENGDNVMLEGEDEAETEVTS